MAVRAVKGTVFSTALRTTRTTARTRQDKHNIRKADSYRGLALVSTKQIPNNSIRGGGQNVFKEDYVTEGPEQQF